MFIGFLDERITVTKMERVFDGRGGWTQQEVLLGEFWASVQPLGIEEQMQYSSVDVSVTTKVYMWYNPQIAPKDCFIKHRGRKYEVKGLINPGYEDKYLELVVNEV